MIKFIGVTVLTVYLYLSLVATVLGTVDSVLCKRYPSTRLELMFPAVELGCWLVEDLND